MPQDARAVQLLDVVRHNRHEVAEQIVARLRDEVPVYRAMPEAELRRLLDAGMTLVLDPPSGRRTRPEMFGAYAELARTRLRDGMDVDSLVRAVRIGARTTIEFVQSHAPQFDSAVMLSLAAALWDAVDHLAEHLRPVEVNEDVREARDRAARRFVSACADGAGIAELSDAAQACELDLSAPHLIVRVPIRDDETARLAIRTLEPATASNGFAVWCDTEIVAVLARLPNNTAPFTAGAATATQLAGCPVAYRNAGRIAAAATALGRSGVSTVDDLGVDLLVVEDDLVGPALATRYLDRLDALGEFGGLLIDSVAAYFENGQRMHDAATSLGVHANTLRYRLAKFEDATGADLHRPRDVAEVWWALRARGVLREPARTPVSPVD
jgi:hypothetical protein